MIDVIRAMMMKLLTNRSRECARGSENHTCHWKATGNSPTKQIRVIYLSCTKREELVEFKKEQ